MVVVVSRGRGTGLDWRREASGRAKPQGKLKRDATRVSPSRAARAISRSDFPTRVKLTYICYIWYMNTKKNPLRPSSTLLDLCLSTAHLSLLLEIRRYRMIFRRPPQVNSTHDR